MPILLTVKPLSVPCSNRINICCAILLLICLPLHAPDVRADTTYVSTSIVVEKVRGKVVKLMQRGNDACGKLDWDTLRQPASLTILNKTIEYEDPKLPLTKKQWEATLTRVVGDQQEMTIVHSWKDEASGLAAALRAANDIRSHGGKAWVFNGEYTRSLDKDQVSDKCQGEFKFKGKPEKIYLTEQEFWSKLRKGTFLDARGKARAARPTPLTWVAGSPKNAKAVNVGIFLKNGKLDKRAYSCDIFEGVVVMGCDTVHKAMLAREAARYANCATQPDVMPFWGLSGASRDKTVVEQLWGKNAELNPKRSSQWWVPAP